MREIVVRFLQSHIPVQELCPCCLASLRDGTEARENRLSNLDAHCQLDIVAGIWEEEVVDLSSDLGGEDAEEAKRRGFVAAEVASCEIVGFSLDITASVSSCGASISQSNSH